MSNGKSTFDSDYVGMIFSTAWTLLTTKLISFNPSPGFEWIPQLLMADGIYLWHICLILLIVLVIGAAVHALRGKRR